MLPDFVWLLLFPRYKRMKKNLLDSWWNYLPAFFSNRFDLALVISNIKGVEGSQKGPTPKMITVVIFVVYYLWKIPVWSMSTDFCSWENQKSYFNGLKINEILDIYRLDWKLCEWTGERYRLRWASSSYWLCEWTGERYRLKWYSSSFWDH